MKTRAWDGKRFIDDHFVDANGYVYQSWCLNSGHFTLSRVDWKLSRFTGLLDKNKDEIYEYHIVKITALSNDHHQRGAWEIRTVKYFMGNPCVCWKSQDTGVPLYPLIVDHTIEILGDTFTTPELLEV